MLGQGCVREANKIAAVRRSQRKVFSIADDPDDFPKLGLIFKNNDADLDPPADGVLISAKSMCHRIINHEDSLGAFSIVIVKSSARKIGMCIVWKYPGVTHPISAAGSCP
jgi:hypothetical protein